MKKCDKKMTIKERVVEFLNSEGIKKTDFYSATGMAASNFKGDGMKSELGGSMIGKILSLYPQLSADWLLRGKGDMLKSDPHTAAEAAAAECDGDVRSERMLPLLPFNVLAGYDGSDVQGIRFEDCDKYVVPDFISLKAEFLIRVSGSSMYPKYSSGDILACRHIDEITFIQWGKVYVIDSRQGCMVKRIFAVDGDPDCILCVSDNEKYPPFQLPLSEVRSLSIVLGAIRLE